ncbi:TPA: hypothetical protein J1246_004661 [Escherichia coli]|nr:hypothetical protein [Escherichia coli]HBA8925226.1 hypothetical protein [Escherichia coli]
MDEKQLQALANELAKNLKTPEVKWSTKTGHDFRFFQYLFSDSFGGSLFRICVNAFSQK